METKQLSVGSRLLVDIIYGLHVLIFLFFPLGFLIPSSWWPQRIEVHFWYSVTLFILFYLWGSIWTIRYRDKLHAICILDTLMQRVRGYSMWDKKNYEHSFVEEMFGRMGIHWLPNRSIPLLLLACILASGILYFLKMKGIVVW